MSRGHRIQILDRLVEIVLWLCESACVTAVLIGDISRVSNKVYFEEACSKNYLPSKDTFWALEWTVCANVCAKQVLYTGVQTTKCVLYTGGQTTKCVLYTSA